MYKAEFYRRVDSAYVRVKGALKRVFPPGSLPYRVLARPASALRRFAKTRWDTYRETAKDGIFYRADELEMCSLFPEKTLQFVLRTTGAKTALDVGCGTGKTLDYLLAHGVHVTGLEGSALARDNAAHPDRIILHNLQEGWKGPKPFDLVWTFEVVEHIHPDYINELMRTLTENGNLVVMSAARPGQGGAGHFNEQEPAYWIEQFSKRGFKLDPEFTDGIKKVGDIFHENMLVFRKA